MNSTEIKKLYKLENTYWWHIGRKSIVKTMIDKYCQKKSGIEILDIGCGTGQILQMLSQFGKAVGIDKDKKAIYFCQKRGLDTVKQGRAEQLPFEENQFDLITVLDVLEHIKEDKKTLKEIVRVLKPKGKALITVPAAKYLWSSHDEALDHKRRYNRKEIKQKIERTSNLKIKKLSYAVTFLFPAIYLFRKLQLLIGKEKLPQSSYVLLPKWLNSGFVAILKLESFLLKYVNLPFGATLIAVAEKGHSANRKEAGD
ncbi:MAG: class I SAM-dependent methyltransferase [Patescibacteria group bacterium]